MSADLPEHVRAELVARWNESHRHYHGPGHLEHGLRVLDHLDATQLTRWAWWFHDGVHHNDSPADEIASAALARDLLAAHLGTAEIAEVCRLVLLTIDHRPAPGDDQGAMICDADLHSLALPRDDYLAQVDLLRRERPDLDDQHWVIARQQRVAALLERERLFHTESGARDWETAARANLTAELNTQHPPH